MSGAKPFAAICCAAQDAALPKAAAVPVLVSTYYHLNFTSYVISGAITVNHWGFTLFEVLNGVARLIRQSSWTPFEGYRRLSVQPLQRMRTRSRAGGEPALWAFFCAARSLRPAPFCLARSCLAIGAAACLFLGGCSPGAEYPSIFPAVHDMPPPRAEAPMNQTEVQKATEDLISQRDHLNAQAPKSTATPSNSTASSASAKKAAPKAPPPATTASVQGAGVQAAGTDLKP
jgi:hypothetical protein